MWRCCVEFFAAYACYDRRWHVVQHRLDWDGHTCCNLLPICIALITVCTAQPCHWWCCETTLTDGCVVNIYRSDELGRPADTSSRAGDAGGVQ